MDRKLFRLICLKHRGLRWADTAGKNLANLGNFQLQKSAENGQFSWKIREFSGLTEQRRKILGAFLSRIKGRKGQFLGEFS